MPRVKRSKVHLKKRRKIRKATKGYKWGRKSSVRLGKTAILKAGQHAQQDRHKKKGQMRQLWQIRINAAVREHGLTYSKFIKALKDNNIEIDRKILADLAVNNPKIFATIIKEIKGTKTSTKTSKPKTAKNTSKSTTKKSAKPVKKETKTKKTTAKK
ncbi:MAG: 50S ribosomal protein L20 [Candidatus Buchananbacteria bacterium]|nr:50S ribosomal protein L20 [Candidatus Buchananbacteria bacterium]